MTATITDLVFALAVGVSVVGFLTLLCAGLWLARPVEVDPTPRRHLAPEPPRYRVVPAPPYDWSTDGD